jgi:hypothetical protein
MKKFCCYFDPQLDKIAEKYFSDFVPVFVPAVDKINDKIAILE